jgi:hypothetical protein
MRGGGVAMSGSNGAGAVATRERAAGSRAQSVPPVGASPSGLVRRRRWGVALAGVAAVVVGAWGFASLWLAAGDRDEVVAMAGDVEAYETIERGDLRTVRVAAGDGVSVVPVSDIDDVVGRVAKSDLHEGSLLTDADLFPQDEDLVASDEAVVGGAAVRAGRPGSDPGVRPRARGLRARGPCREPRAARPAGTTLRGGGLPHRGLGAHSGGRPRRGGPMGDNMPYMLEKGGTMRLMEDHINNKMTGHQRRTYLDAVRSSEDLDDAAWFIDGPTNLWTRAGVTWGPDGSGTAARDRLIRTWFGSAVVPPKKLTPLLSSMVPPTTGFWIAYEGDVHRIVRRAVRWALELSLELRPTDTGRGRDNPLPIELFWKCLAPWFEAWVVRRPAPGTPQGGVVTVTFITPTHVGADVSQTPLAGGPNVQVGNGVGAPSNSRDYQVLGLGGVTADAHTAVAQVSPAKRAYGMWVVTHKEQVKSAQPVIVNTARDRDLAQWGIAQLGCFRGDGDVVVVSPSLAAGGVRHDGSV